MSISTRSISTSVLLKRKFDPGIGKQPDDIIFACYRHRDLRTDLHLYRGKIPDSKHHGAYFGHESAGGVVETDMM